jgi:hypothetical protein
MKLAVLALLLMAPAFSRDWRTDRLAYRQAIVEARAQLRDARREVLRARLEARRDMRQYRRELRDVMRREREDPAGMHRIL